LLRFDNVTLSRPQECQRIVTITIKDVVIEPLNGAAPTGLAEATLYYGVTDDADGYVTEDEAADQRLEGLSAVAYNADFSVGDRVSGFPTMTRPVSCTADLQEVFFTVFEKRSTVRLGTYGDPVGSKNTPFYENSLSNFPMEVSAELTSYDSSRVYRATYTVDVKPSDGTLLDTPVGDMSAVQIEHNAPTGTEECQLIVTVTIRELVVEPLDATASTEPRTIKLRYGLYYNANETLQGEQNATIDDVLITYEGDLMIGDRVTGFPPFKHVIPCPGVMKQGYYRIFEEEEYLRDRNFFINQNRLYEYPVQGTDEFTSNPSRRHYRLTYTVEVERVQGMATDIGPEAVDMSTIQIENNP
jgi:hypothetical protein